MIMLLQQLFALLLCSVRTELVPRDILHTRPQTFRYGHQQDSFEYLGYVLDQLHEEEKKRLTNGAPSASPATNGYESFQNDVDDAYIRDTPDFGWADSAEPQTIEADAAFSALSGEKTNATSLEASGSGIFDGLSSPKPNQSSVLQPEPAPSPPAESVQTIVQRIFGGKMAVTYKCLECQSTSTNVDSFFDLQLSFPHTTENGTPIKSNYYTTQSLLDAYFSTESLVDDDKYHCGKCAKLCDGERNINLVNGPSNLILVIKHFKYDRKFHVRRKLLQKVHHNDILTVTTREDANGDCVRHTYRLYAVIVHSGMNIDSGHYYTFGADQMGNWFKFNDNYISSSTLAEIKHLSDLNTPYILFYEMMATERSDANTSKAEFQASFTHSEESMDTDEPLRPNKFEWPELSELPPMLQDFVHRDNIAYTQEYQRKNYDDEGDFRYSKHRRSDNDQDPPSSCGGNLIESSNRYIC